ncbi:hypothetical protein ElyMa_003192700 [Elysia marginata]|uniref:Uncharacterized protein n=1 Tax=Elysia marginata TaxID=1093978 RepID=A0AAV4IYN9_9GAST|nr:hypothetical protein ElyMa_003192700 [Elysia marginata]
MLGCFKSEGVKRDTALVIITLTSYSSGLPCWNGQVHYLRLEVSLSIPRQDETLVKSRKLLIISSSLYREIQRLHDRWPSRCDPTKINFIVFHASCERQQT